MDIAILHMSSPPPPPREIRPDLSPEVEAVILKALEKKPEDRYQSGRALALALERALRRQPKPTLPTIRSVPERVTIGLLAHPLPSLPPIPDPHAEQANQVEAVPLTAESDAPTHSPVYEPSPVQVQVYPVEQQWQAEAASPPPPPQPLRPSKKPSPWILVGAAGLVSLCFLACLVIGGLALLMREANPGAAVVPLKTTAPKPTATQQKPAPPPLAFGGDYRLKFARCEEEGCLVVANTGSAPFPLEGLMLRGKDAGLSGEQWDVETLQPGQCVKVVKSEEWVKRMPEDLSCEVVGEIPEREGKDRFWNRSFTIFYEDEDVVDCMKSGDWCEVLIPGE
jgi:hypothetical protein